MLGGFLVWCGVRSSTQVPLQPKIHILCPIGLGLLGLYHFKLLLLLKEIISSILAGLGKMQG
jgi:hypothetical protein